MNKAFYIMQKSSSTHYDFPGQYNCSIYTIIIRAPNETSGTAYYKNGPCYAPCCICWQLNQLSTSQKAKWWLGATFYSGNSQTCWLYTGEKRSISIIIMRDLSCVLLLQISLSTVCKRSARKGNFSGSKLEL